MSQVEMCKIRPAARHLSTIGSDLIQDQVAAIVELVKNAYDADSPDAQIYFKRKEDENLFEIKITDHGHGMSKNDVMSKWLVPSTTYKLNKRISPHGRIMQGRKGIGRYAASILGYDLSLKTVDENGEKTELSIDWKNFNKYQYLDEVEIPVNSSMVSENSGTTMIIHSNIDEINYWYKKGLDKLRFELKKLIPPITDETFDTSFSIKIIYDNFFKEPEKNNDEDIVPYPILDLFDYKISGTISKYGKGTLIYESPKLKNAIKEKIEVDFGDTNCGELVIDVRVYDRDKEAINNLIKRGLKDEYTGNYVSQLQARQLLDKVNGIGVYRNGFRIRPLGDSDFDWLKLNEQRIQNPSMKIGSNQVIGYIHIQSEELSNLEETSARDGLKNNESYERLKVIVNQAILQLEKRRFILRRKLGITKPKNKVEKHLGTLYDSSKLISSVTNSLKKANIDGKVIDEIVKKIENEQEQKNKAINEIQKAVAIYQGQATLGKIINVILHEGRRPLNYFKNQIPNLQFYVESFKSQPNLLLSDKIIELTSETAENANIFVNLFGRLDPLAAKKRQTKKEIVLKDILNGVVKIFQNELKEKNINVILDCSEDIHIKAWMQDIYTIFANLIDNSIYWIEEKNCTKRQIKIEAYKSSELINIDYKDSGPGIDSDLLESGIIFEPEFSTKLSSNTGLGLSIAGEAASRNGLLLTALEYEGGAHFKIETDVKF